MGTWLPSLLMKITLTTSSSDLGSWNSYSPWCRTTSRRKRRRGEHRFLDTTGFYLLAENVYTIDWSSEERRVSHERLCSFELWYLERKRERERRRSSTTCFYVVVFLSPFSLQLQNNHFTKFIQENIVQRQDSLSFEWEDRRKRQRLFRSQHYFSQRRRSWTRSEGEWHVNDWD